MVRCCDTIQKLLACVFFSFSFALCALVVVVSSLQDPFAIFVGWSLPTRLIGKQTA